MKNFSRFFSRNKIVQPKKTRKSIKLSSKQVIELKRLISEKNNATVKELMEPINEMLAGLNSEKTVKQVDNPLAWENFFSNTINLNGRGS